MQGLSLVGILLFWVGFALPCLSLPFPYSFQVSPGPTVEGLGDQVNSSFTEMEEEELGEEEMEEQEMEVQLEPVQVEEGFRDQQVAFHNDSHGTLVSKGWWAGTS